MIHESIRRDQHTMQDIREPSRMRTHQEIEEEEPKEPQGELIRLRRPVIIRQEAGRRVDGKMVSPHFYDCFNYALLSNGADELNIAIGISSANAGEGKTLVACNLAISLTVAYQRKTVLVDMNVHKPRLHEVFDVPIGPGLLEAVGDGAIQVARTSISDLYVLTAGIPNGRLSGGLSTIMTDAELNLEPSLQLEQVAAFRDVLYSLKGYFSFVIVDMPAVQEHLVPLLFTNQLDGVLFVVHGGVTKQGDLDHALQLINERRVLGFVYNGAERKAPSRRKKQ